MKSVKIVSTPTLEHSFPEKISLLSNDVGTIVITSYVHSLQLHHQEFQQQIHQSIEQEFQDILTETELYTFQSKILQKTAFDIWSYNQQHQSYFRLSISVSIVTPELLYFTSVGTLRSYLIRMNEIHTFLHSTNLSAIPIGSEPFCTPTILMVPLSSKDVIFVRSSVVQSLLSDEDLMLHYSKAMNILDNTTNALESVEYYLKQKSFEVTTIVEEYQLLLLEIVDETVVIQNTQDLQSTLPIFKPLLSGLFMLVLLLTTTCFLLYKEVKNLHRITDVLIERNEEILMNTSTKYMPKVEQLLQSTNKVTGIDSIKVVTQLQASEKGK